MKQCRNMSGRFETCRNVSDVLETCWNVSKRVKLFETCQDGWRRVGTFPDVFERFGNGSETCQDGSRRVGTFPDVLERGRTFPKRFETCPEETRLRRVETFPDELERSWFETGQLDAVWVFQTCRNRLLGRLETFWTMFGRCETCCYVPRRVGTFETVQRVRTVRDVSERFRRLTFRTVRNV